MVKSSNRVYPNMQRLSSNALSSTFFLVFKIRYPIVSEEQINLIGTGIGRHLLGKAGHGRLRRERRARGHGSPGAAARHRKGGPGPAGPRDEEGAGPGRRHPSVAEGTNAAAACPRGWEGTEVGACGLRPRPEEGQQQDRAPPERAGGAALAHGGATSSAALVGIVSGGHHRGTSADRLVWQWQRRLATPVLWHFVMYVGGGCGTAERLTLP